MAGPPLRIRRAEPRDALAVAEIQVVTWRAAYAHILPAETLEALDVDRAARFWLDRISTSGDTGARLVVAEPSGTVVGFSSFGPSRDDDLKGSSAVELYALYVNPEFWGSGAGHALMSATLDHWSESGAGDASLWVLERNVRARTFYERSGWVLDRRVQPVGDAAAGIEVRYRTDPVRRANSAAVHGG
ncbi:GNAT family N-acetyltransferase [Streptomyces sp. NPDC051211]|uniref:GNAT family N-acetyltransferase n=1 Tax=Streptomyces sp. NPDC051211 TaxID=3154643 RepID=UPI003450FDBD